MSKPKLAIVVGSIRPNRFGGEANLRSPPGFVSGAPQGFQVGQCFHATILNKQLKLVLAVND